MSDWVIRIENISKSYRMYTSPQDKLKELLHPFKKKYHREFWALKDIALDIYKGKTYAIIGRNGSGKSTLLQLICGVLKPTSGNIYVKGKIAALLELGIGFNYEFTGRENVYLQGAVQGFTKNQIDKKFDEINSFIFMFFIVNIEFIIKCIDITFRNGRNNRFE